MDMKDSLREMDAFLKSKEEVWKQEETSVLLRNILLEKYNDRRKK